MLMAACLVAMSCSTPGPGTMAAVHTDTVDVPAIPLPATAHLAVDAAALDSAACDECNAIAATGDTADAARFFFGRLALGAIDELASMPSPARQRALLGNLFVSGYFGGIYLRANLSSIGVDPADGSPVSAVQDLIGRATLGALDDIAGDLGDAGRGGDVSGPSVTWSVALAAIDGYNRGYLELALAHPPVGAATPDPLVCTSLFDCRTAALPLGALDRFAAQGAELARPTDPTSAQVASTLAGIGSASVPGGRDVWTKLLSNAGFSPAAYRSIIDLSGGFLEVTQVALWLLAAGARGDVESGRAGLASAAGLLVWAGSYFLGLQSPLADDQLPQLHCTRAD